MVVAGTYNCFLSLPASYSFCPETAPQLVMVLCLVEWLKTSLLKRLGHLTSCLKWVVAICHKLEAWNARVVRSSPDTLGVPLLSTCVAGTQMPFDCQPVWDPLLCLWIERAEGTKMASLQSQFPLTGITGVFLCESLSPSGMKTSGLAKPKVIKVGRI